MMPETWHKCYDESWRDLITPESFAHPAKMSRALLVRIFDELFANGALHKAKPSRYRCVRCGMFNFELPVGVPPPTWLCSVTDCGGDLEEEPGLTASVVLDPFGGIGSTGIEGASRGVHVICVELEAKFSELARANVDLHRRDWQTMNCPLPIMVNGDSRKLRQILASADAVVTSPPYVSGGHHTDVMGAWNANGGGHGVEKDEAGYGKSDGQLGTMREGDVDAVVASPPYGDQGLKGGDQRTALADVAREVGRGKRTASVGQDGNESYGDTAGNLGTMAQGSVDAVIASPPYAEIATGAGGLNTKPSVLGDQQSGRSPDSPSQSADQRYGESPGQLAKLPQGDGVAAIVGSPPFQGSLANDGKDFTPYTGPGHYAYSPDVAARRKEDYGSTAGQLGALPDGGGVEAVVSSPPFPQPYTSGGGINVKGYGADGADKVGDRTYQSKGGDRTEGNLETLPDTTGPADTETFWSASKQIVSECYAILKPGGIAVWVVKSFVRDKKIVDFPGDWRKLCEHLGFELIKEVHASLVTEERHGHLFDGESVKRRERKSFFRRLAESKGSPRIDWETVLFMRKH